jgi:hypothetical protein
MYNFKIQKVKKIILQFYFSYHEVNPFMYLSNFIFFSTLKLNGNSFVHSHFIFTLHLMLLLAKGVKPW